MNVSNAECFMATLCPETPAQQMRFDLAFELLDDLRRLHRDLKPSNVLVADRGPKVVDFGIAHAADATSLTQSGSVVGSRRGWHQNRPKGKRAVRRLMSFPGGPRSRSPPPEDCHSEKVAQRPLCTVSSTRKPTSLE
jgi:serine/threonine protein kinase